MISLAGVRKVADSYVKSRFTKKAIVELREWVVTEISVHAAKALKLANHAGRKTIREDDVLFGGHYVGELTKFHINSIELEMRKHGAKRIGKGAANALGVIIEKKLSKVLAVAFEYSRHAKKKNISKKDVLLAME